MKGYDRLKELLSSRAYSPKKPNELYESDFSDLSLDEFAEALQQAIDEGIAAYGKKGKLLSAENAGYMRGSFRAHAKGFGFFIPDDEYRRRTGGDLFIPPEETMDAINDDVVIAQMTREGKEGDKKGEGRIIRIVEHRTKSVIGTLRELVRVRGRAPKYYVKADDRRINFIVELDDIGLAKAGDKVEVEIVRYPSTYDNAEGRIVGVFGDSESTEANYAAILREHGISESFSEQIIAISERVAAREISLEGRTDLRDKCIITIDGADAKDLDDAVSVEKTDDGYLLGVHIADVSEYVKEGSELDNEAYERGTSVYFIDKVVPMLPEAISNGCCSLNSGSDKYALSALITLDSEGEIVDCELCESVIRTAVRGVYSELNDVVEKGRDSNYYDKYKVVGKMLPDMLELYEILARKSEKRGALELESTESKIIIEDGEPVDIVKCERGVTEMLIEQFMLCANEAVASWLFWQDMPCVYRIHEDPSPEKIQTFATFAYNLGLNVSALKAKKLHSRALQGVLRQAKEKGVSNTVSYVMLRSLMKARYSSLCSPHFGLAIEKYCHFTSPIRRYPDLSVHRIIKCLIRGEMDYSKVEHFAAFASRSAEASSENEIRATAAERDIEDLYRVIYMSKRIGEVYRGTISSVTSFGLFVELENTCEGLVPISSLDGYFEYNERAMTLSCGYTVYALGKQVDVRIVDADIISRKIDMEIVSME